MGAGKESHIVRHNGCRNGDITTAFEAPEFATRVKVESTDVFPAVGDDLSPSVRNSDSWRAPGAAGLFSRDAPELFPIFCIEDR